MSDVTEIEPPSAALPLISVIVPTLDYGPYLLEAVRSILEDGWARLEVVVVLDGPAQDPPASFLLAGVHHMATGARGGAAAAINLGAQHATGDFIARLDADDVSYPGRFATQIQFFHSQPSLIAVGTRANLIDEASRVTGNLVVEGDQSPRTALLRRNPFVHSSMMFSREAFESLGGYDENCVRMQDYELLLRMAIHGTVAIIPDVFVGYRVHPNQTSRKPAGFIRLMRLLSRRKRTLARMVGRNPLLQGCYDIAYAAGLMLLYRGARSPKYVLQSTRSDSTPTHG